MKWISNKLPRGKSWTFCLVCFDLARSEDLLYLCLYITSMPVKNGVDLLTKGGKFLWIPKSKQAKQKVQAYSNQSENCDVMLD